MPGVFNAGGFRFLGLLNSVGFSMLGGIRFLGVFDAGGFDYGVFNAPAHKKPTVLSQLALTVPISIVTSSYQNTIEVKTISIHDQESF